MPNYGEKASETVESAMHRYKHGDLKSGKSGAKVKNRKQAIAIGLSEAREKGAKVPPAPKAKKKAARKKVVAKKMTAKKKVAKKKAAKKRTTKKKVAKAKKAG
jgi:hypothetical protein